MGQDISASLDALIDVLQTKLVNSGDAVPEYTGGSDIASKVMYITALFNIIYSEEEETGGGSSGGIMVVQIDQTGTLNKTYQEIYDAFMNMNIVLINMPMAGQGFFTVIGQTDDFELLAKTYDYENPTAIFSADSADDYPKLTQQ